MATAPSSTTNVPSTVVPAQQLSLIDKLQSVLGLSEEDATSFYNSLTPIEHDALNSRLDTIVAGQKTNQPAYTKQELMQIFGLTEAQANSLLGVLRGGQPGGLYSDPTANICLRLIVIAETLGIDLRKTRITVAYTKRGISVKAAGERFSGAKVAFIVSMVFGGVSVGGAIGFGTHSLLTRNKPAEDRSQWNSPFTLQIITSPGSAGAEYARSEGEYFGGVEDANAVVADTTLQELGDKISSILGIVQSASKAIG